MLFTSTMPTHAEKNRGRRVLFPLKRANTAPFGSSDRAAGRTTHGGTGEARGVGGWVPDPPGHAKPGCALENKSPAGRNAGAGQGCALAPLRPRAPFIGTQAGPLPAGLAGGSRAGRQRRLPPGL
jgi:hypothetical protein